MTGSIYGDKILYNKGLKGETQSLMLDNTIVQNTHHAACFEDRKSAEWRKQHVDLFNGRGIIIIRDLHDSLLSYWTDLHQNDACMVLKENVNFELFAFV